MDRDDLQRQYIELKPRYRCLKGVAKATLQSVLDNRGIKVHLLQSRVKRFDSFSEKAEKKQCERPFDEICDICGLRVICLLRSDVSRVRDAIRQSFNVISEDNKLEGSDVSSFGYSAIHFVVTLKKPYKGKPRYDIGRLRFEIQVTTIAMHAWSSVSHYLDYKTQADVPTPMKKDFNALSGLFYVADTHFEMFFKAREASRQEMAKAFSKQKLPLDAEINLDTLTAYLQQKFPEREHVDSKYVSELVGHLLAAGYSSIGDMERIIERGWDAAIAAEQEFKRRYGHSFAFTNVVLIGVLFDLVDPNYHRVIGGPPPPEKLVELVKP